MGRVGKGAIGVQGTSNRLFPGWEDMWWKNCVFLPAEGKQNATFAFKFKQSGKSLLVQPCTVGDLTTKQSRNSATTGCPEVP